MEKLRLTKIALTKTALTPFGLTRAAASFYAAVWSLRQVDDATTCMRVRRSSDNAEQDFGFADGYVDVSAVETFCGAGDGYVVKLYDQEGNSHAIQTTAESQPQVVEAGTFYTANGKPSIKPTDGRYLTATMQTAFTGNVVKTDALDISYTQEEWALGDTFRLPRTNMQSFQEMVMSVNDLSDVVTANETYWNQPNKFILDDPTYGKFTDADGNEYTGIRIGNQVWGDKNLNVGTYVASTDTGAAHSDVSDNGIIEKYCNGNDEANCALYGGLYDWDEAMGYTETEGARGICPAGWHIPTDEEWKTLEMALGMTREEADGTSWRGTDEGTKLKEGGSSGFEVALAGGRSHTGTFSSLGSSAYFWSSSVSGSNAWRRLLNSSESRVNRNASNQAFGFSVRCLKN